MSDESKRLPFFPEYAADELADPRKQEWSDRQWGWYFRLKILAWNSEPKGKLPNDPKKLMAWARVKTTGKHDKNQWEEVMQCFEVQGEFLVHPDLVNFARSKGKEVNKKQINGEIGGLRTKLKGMAADDPERKEIEERISQLQAKTDSGKRAAVSTSKKSRTDADKKQTAKKSSGSRGLKSTNMAEDPQQPELVPVEKSMSTKFADIQKELGPVKTNDKGQTHWNGKWWYPEGLQKQLKLLQEELTAKRTALENVEKTDSSYRTMFVGVQSLKRCIAECKYCLGVLAQDIPAPENPSRKKPVGLDAAQRVSSIETISDPAELRALLSEFQSRIKSYAGEGVPDAFAKKRIQANQGYLEKVNKRMAELGVTAAN